MPSRLCRERAGLREHGRADAALGSWLTDGQRTGPAPLHGVANRSPPPHVTATPSPPFVPESTIARGWRSEQACPAVSEERQAACGSKARRGAGHRSRFPPAAREGTLSPPWNAASLFPPAIAPGTTPRPRVSRQASGPQRWAAPALATFL